MKRRTHGRAGMPSEKHIRAYWAASDLWASKGFDSAHEFLDRGICMACGWKAERIERAHIVPRCYGGADTVENLHMLCVPCHRDSEYLLDGPYWRWFYTKDQHKAMLFNALRIGALTLIDLQAAGYLEEAL